MMISFRKSWLCIWSVVALFCLATLPAQSAERAQFPKACEELQGDFDGYMTQSERALDALDKLTTGVEPASDQWKKTCASVTSALTKAHSAALTTHRKTGATKLPDEVENWYVAEQEAWTNVGVIGSELIGFHDQVIAQTKLIKDDVLPAYNKKVGNMKLLAAPANKMIGEMAGTVDTGSAAQTKLEDNFQAVLVDLGKLVRGLNEVNDEIKKNKDNLAASRYQSLLSTLQRKDIDPDQSGVFVKHERAWEQSLTKALSVYDVTYKKYVHEVYAVESMNFLAAYVYLKNMPRAASGLATWLRAKMPKGILTAKPNATITNLSVVKMMEVGRNFSWKVKVTNPGPLAFEKDSLHLICEVADSPKGYNLRDGTLSYKLTNTEVISTGETYTFDHRFKAPPGVGVWKMELNLEGDNKVFDKKNFIIRIEGSSLAEIKRITTPKTMRIDRTSEFQVTIENTGQVPLGREDVLLVCDVIKPPKGFRARSSDFHFEIEPSKIIVPGAAYEFRQRLEPPAGVGEWELEVSLEVRRRVMPGKRRFKVTVEPK